MEIFVFSIPIVERISHQVFTAKSVVEEPYKAEITMYGYSSENALKNLFAIIHSKPFQKHHQ